jgi:hypothetical protein
VLTATNHFDEFLRKIHIRHVNKSVRVLVATYKLPWKGLGMIWGCLGVALLTIDNTAENVVQKTR